MCQIMENIAMTFAEEAATKAAAEATADATEKAKQQTMENAKHMIKDGLSAEKIVQYTNLTLDEVHNLMAQTA